MIDLEVTSVLRGLRRRGALAPDVAESAIHNLARWPLERAAHRHLLPRCWELRSNLSTHDAAYVALAELLQAPLLTADVRMSRARGLRCTVEVVG